jgi:hypothetical protein
MGLSKRERIIFIVTLICVGILIVNEFVINTVYGELVSLGKERDELRLEVEEAENLIARRASLERRWDELLANGMWNRGAAESKVFDSLREWSSKANMTLGNVRPEQSTAEKGMSVLRFTLSGEGRLASVARLLYEIESSPVPVKISSMSLGSTKDDGSKITMSMYLSILFVDKESPSYDFLSEANDDYDF